MAQVSYFYSMKLYDLGVQCALQDAGLLKEAAAFNPAYFEELLPLVRQGRVIGRDIAHEGAHWGEHIGRHKIQAQLMGHDKGDPSEITGPYTPRR